MYGHFTALVALSFAAAIGLTFLVLGCALPQYQNWWPMFVLMFYILAPIPTAIARRYAEDVENSSALIEVCIFLTCGIVVSAYGLPIILARAPLHAPVIEWGACMFIMAGNTTVFLTILGYFCFLSEDDDGFGML